MTAKSALYGLAQPRFRNVYVLQSPCPNPAHSSSDRQATTFPGPRDPDPAKSCPIEVPYFYSLWWNARTEDKVQNNTYDRAYPNITLPRSTEYVVTPPSQPK